MGTMASDSTRTSSVTAAARPVPRHLTLAEFVLDELRRRIVLGAMAPGSRVEVDKLAVELGSSRIPVREAVRQLEAEGLVVNVPRHGVVVSEVRRQDIDDAYQLLEEAELIAAKRAVGQVTPELLERMRHWAAEIDRLREEPRSAEMLIAHRSFHFAMFETVGEGVLLRHIRMLWYACERYLVASMSEGGHSQKAMHEHEEFVTHLEKQDLRGLTKLIRAHLRASCQRAHNRLG